jgi:magnesium-protoporphyrin IX monomethyl ester (oxidative) cyclase
MAAVLEKNHEVRVIDAPAEGWRNLDDIGDLKYRQGLSNEEIAFRVADWRSDVIVITVPYSGWWISINEVISEVKMVNEDATTVLTGLHPSVRPKECLQDPNIDFTVIGEPEQTISELVDTLEGKKNPEKVRGIGFVKNGKTIITPPRPFIKDLDSLPFPARHLMPMKEYFAAVKEVPFHGEICKPWAMVTTSRGCPHQCVFCTIHNVMGRCWRPRSSKNVVDEIEQLVRTYRVKQIDFWDDNMTIDKKRAEEIFDLIKERKLDIEWFAPNGLRADTLDESLLRKMKRSGCKGIRVAPESGVQRIVSEVVKKNLDLKAVETAVTLSKKVGISVGCFFVIGLIGETKADINETIKYSYKLRKLGANRFFFSIAMPVYGSELYEQALKGGYLKQTFSDSSLAEVEPLIETPEFTIEEIRELCSQAHRINYAVTPEKVLKGLRHPKKALNYLLGN